MDEMRVVGHYLAGANWGDLRIWQIWRRQGPTNPSIPLMSKGPLPNHIQFFFAEHSKPNWRCMQGKIKENTEYRRLHSLELHEFQIHLIEISLSSSYSADVRPITPLVTHSEEISPRVNVNVWLPLVKVKSFHHIRPKTKTRRATFECKGPSKTGTRKTKNARICL